MPHPNSSLTLSIALVLSSNTFSSVPEDLIWTLIYHNTYVDNYSIRGWVASIEILLWINESLSDCLERGSDCGSEGFISEIFNDYSFALQLAHCRYYFIRYYLNIDAAQMPTPCLPFLEVILLTNTLLISNHNRLKVYEKTAYYKAHMVYMSNIWYLGIADSYQATALLWFRYEHVALFWCDGAAGDR